MISYAQNFEDVILWRALKQVTSGFYIDCGAQDPVLESVSLLFYEAGWRGVHVEPSAYYADKLRRLRPDEEVLEVAVGREDGELSFSEIEGTGLSTADADLAEQHEVAGYLARTRTVPMMRMSSILNRYVDRDIHWLKIDIEGMEHEAIESWVGTTARPWIVVVESISADTLQPNFQLWESSLHGLGYNFVYADMLNRFYIISERMYLSSYFGPGPNCFDGFAVAPVTFMFHSVAREIAAERAALKRAAGAVQTALPAHGVSAGDAFDVRLQETNASLNQLVSWSQRLDSTHQASLSEIRRLSEARTETFRARNTELTARLKLVEGELVDVKRQLRRIRCALSWKLTFPFRWLWKFVKRPFKAVPRSGRATWSAIRKSTRWQGDRAEAVPVHKHLPASRDFGVRDDVNGRAVVRPSMLRTEAERLAAGHRPKAESKVDVPS